MGDRVLNEILDENKSFMLILTDLLSNSTLVYVLAMLSELMVCVPAKTLVLS